LKKILFVANTDWYLYNYRLPLARYLRAQGFEVVLVSPEGRFVTLLQQAGFRWVAWNVGRQTIAPWKELAVFLRLMRLYRCERPVLVQHYTIKPVLYGSLAAGFQGVRGIVNSITGLGYVFLGQAFGVRVLRWVIIKLYRFAFCHFNCALVFENDVDRQSFIQQKIIAAERTWLVEGVGVDTDSFTPTSEPAGTPLVVLPARMLWEKGVGTLVEAARLLKNMLPVRVALVGVPDPGNPSTVDEANLRQWEKEGLIEWWGWRDDMQAVYACSHIVTLPTSYGEGVPTVLLEAAACGRPIVATDIPGCRAVVQPGKNGLLVPPNDPHALAEALRQLVSDPDLRCRMGAAGRQLVLERFTIGHVNEAMLDVYHTVLNGNPTPSLRL
jgi:glycosyltransferase involved in cell wall biosynthesis